MNTILLLTFSFVVLDFLTGIVKAFATHTYDSSIMREGLFHKVGSFIIIALGILGDYTQQFLDIGVNIPLTKALCVYIITMEICSIIENVGKINPEIVPDKIKPFFSKLNDKGEKDDEDKQ